MPGLTEKPVLRRRTLIVELVASSRAPTAQVIALVRTCLREGLVNYPGHDILVRTKQISVKNAKIAMSARKKANQRKAAGKPNLRNHDWRKKP